MSILSKKLKSVIVQPPPIVSLANASSRSTGHPLPPVRQVKKQRGGEWRVLGLFFLVLALACVGGWYFGKQSSPSQVAGWQTVRTPEIMTNEQPIAAASVGAEQEDEVGTWSFSDDPDEVKTEVAVKLVTAIENYFWYYGKFPWTTEAAGSPYYYNPLDKNQDATWITALVDDQYGITGETAARILSHHDYFVYKPAGNIDLIYTWVCFRPSSNDLILEAAIKCNRQNRLVPYADLGFEPCQTEDGKVPTKLSGEYNLYCVINDGTYQADIGSVADPNLAVKKNRDAERKSDLMAIHQALVLYYSHHQKYPTNEQYVNLGDENLSPDYIATIPKPPLAPEEPDYLYTPICKNVDPQEKCTGFSLCTQNPLEVPVGAANSRANTSYDYCPRGNDCQYFCVTNPQNE
jgi:hypothetical protein